MNLALALLLCHHRTVDRVCCCYQSYPDENKVHDLLNLILVVFIAGKNLYEVVESTCTWECRLNLSVQSDEFCPWHDRECELGTLCLIVRGACRGSALDVRHEERKESKYVGFDTILRYTIWAGLEKVLSDRYSFCCRTTVRWYQR